MHCSARAFRTRKKPALTNSSYCPGTFRAVACDSMPLPWPQNTGCFENLQGRNGGAFASCVRVSSLTSSVQKQRLNTTVVRVSPPPASLHRTFWYQIGSPVLGTTRSIACHRKVTQQSKRITLPVDSHPSGSTLYLDLAPRGIFGLHMSGLKNSTCTKHFILFLSWVLQVETLQARPDPSV